MNSMSAYRVTVRKRKGRENFQMAYNCPKSGKRYVRSTKTSNKKEAQRAALLWEMELQQTAGIIPVSWQSFLIRYEDEHLATKAADTRKNYQSTFRSFETHMGEFKRIDQIDAAVCSQFAAKLRTRKAPETTIAKHLRQIGAALGWAETMGIINQRPKIRKPPTPKRNFRGRSLSLFEFSRLLIATRDFLPCDLSHDWIDSLKAIWLTGLRISEAMQLHFNHGPIHLDMSAKHPRIVFQVEGQKNNLDQKVPLTQDAVRFFQQLGRTDGFALEFPGERVPRVGTQTAIRTISSIGEYSEIITGTGKFCSAHDLRRSFGSRWALRVHPIVLKILMRHEDLSTTLKYYVDLDCDAVAEQLLRGYNPSGFGI